MAETGRIDTHQHVLPPEYVAWLAGHGIRDAGGRDLFDPLFDELNRRGAVVFIHPAELPGPAVEGIPPFAADFLLDTTRAAIKLVTSGTVARCADLKLILSHAGGFVPYIAHRLAIAGPAYAGPRRRTREILADLRTFHFDTALSAGPFALPSLLAFADPTRILYGSDWPFATARTVAYFNDLFADEPLDAATRAAIDRGNAERLFPRLARPAAG
jgi:predicted TIM-barrel fold metal-dependent hydrolase